MFTYIARKIVAFTASMAGHCSGDGGNGGGHCSDLKKN